MTGLRRPTGQASRLAPVAAIAPTALRYRLAAALALGALSVAGFAPFEFFPLPFMTLAGLFLLCERSPAPWQAAAAGFAWGLGVFLGGVSWVYVSLHDVGGMVAPLAATATLLFCVCLALYPAAVGYAWVRIAARAGNSGIAPQAGRCLLFAGLWTLAEMLRGWLFTGFPWLSIGYSQSPPSPFAGYAPLIGVYGVSFLVVLSAAWLVMFRRRPRLLLGLGALILIGGGLRMIAWTAPTGAPIRVSLLQGNIPQSLKWDPQRQQLSLDTYERLAAAHPAQLTVLPETAIPLFLDQVPRDYLERLTVHGEVLLGVPLRGRDGSYANGAVALDPALKLQAYAKSHLVPFGEYIPPGFSWFFDLVRIPMADFSPGPRIQAPLIVAGQKIAPNICYEDLFGEEIIRALPEATLLINLSNTAWFGHSLAQPQHLQIARMRAIETGRPMLRATNTGMTAAIAPDGRTMDVLPSFSMGALSVEVRGYAGLTPYARFGNSIALGLALLAVSASLLGIRRR